MAKKTIKPTKPSQKPITFNEGGMHQTMGIPAGNKMPTSAMKKAMSGKAGPLAKKQALFKKNVLTGPKKGGK